MLASIKFELEAGSWLRIGPLKMSRDGTNSIAALSLLMKSPS